MLSELSIATVMVFLTVMLHAVGMLLLNSFSRVAAFDERAKGIHPLSTCGVAVIIVLVLGLFFVHGLEIWLYAILYLELGAIEGLRHAVYFSTQTYAAIGYSDDAIAHDWKLVAAIEGINGLLLIGWSTAFFVTMMGRFGQR